MELSHKFTHCKHLNRCKYKNIGANINFKKTEPFDKNITCIVSMIYNNNNIYVAGCDDGTVIMFNIFNNRVRIIKTEQLENDNSPINSIAIGRDHVVVCDNNGNIFYVSKLTLSEWKQSECDIDIKLTSIIYDFDNYRYLAVGNNGTLIYSEDLTNEWNNIEINIDNNLNCIFYDSYNEYYIVCGDNIIMYASTNEFTNASKWYQKGDTNIIYNQVAYNVCDNVFIAVGNNGYIGYISNLNALQWERSDTGLSMPRLNNNELAENSKDIMSISYDIHNHLYYAITNKGNIISTENLTNTWMEHKLISETSSLKCILYNHYIGMDLIIGNGFILYGNMKNHIVRNRRILSEISFIYPIGSSITSTKDINPYCYLGIGKWENVNTTLNIPESKPEYTFIRIE